MLFLLLVVGGEWGETLFAARKRGCIAHAITPPVFLSPADKDTFLAE